MEWNFWFLFNSILLGVGLAMDAFSVSLANGLNENRMKVSRMSFIAGIYALFQLLMPLLGWICVHTVLQIFSALEKLIPWIALLLLVYIGGKMLIESIRGDADEEADTKLSFGVLIVQGIATSIDALSVGFTIADYNFAMAFAASLIIGIVTFMVCMTGLVLGKRFGTKFSGKAGILGGCILIIIGIEIFVKGLFF